MALVPWGAASVLRPPPQVPFHAHNLPPLPLPGSSPSLPNPLSTPSPHPNLLSVRTGLAPAGAKGGRGKLHFWVGVNFSLRALPIPFSSPLCSASSLAAGLVILNRAPDLSAEVSGFRASFEKCSGRRVGKEEEREVGRRSVRGRERAGGHPTLSALQVNTGHTRVRAEPRAFRYPFRTGNSSPGRLLSSGWGVAFSFRPQLLPPPDPQALPFYI